MHSVFLSLSSLSVCVRYAFISHVSKCTIWNTIQSELCTVQHVLFCACNVIDFMYDVSIYNRSLFVHSRLVKLHSLALSLSLFYQILLLYTQQIWRKMRQEKRRRGRKRRRQDEDKNHRPVNLYMMCMCVYCIRVIPLLHSKPINANVIVKFLRLLLLVFVIVCFWSRSNMYTQYTVLIVLYMCIVHTCDSIFIIALVKI